MMGLQNENREENAVFSITEIEKEISSSKEPVTSILSSLEADMYWNYYQGSIYFKKNQLQAQGCQLLSSEILGGAIPYSI